MSNRTNRRVVLLALGSMLIGAGLLIPGGLAAFGCIRAKAPERIDIRVGDPGPTRVDPGRVPQPRTLEEAQRELDLAYANLRQLEQDNARLHRKADEYKRERDDYKKRVKKLEKD